MESTAAVSWRIRALVLVLSSLSIVSLLLYFFGAGRFRDLTFVLLTVEVVGLCLLSFARQARAFLATGLRAGALATLVYDAVRVPLIHGSIPVFKSISFFGTLLMGVDRPTTASEILGWGYHLSNGISFGLMYVALFAPPRAWSAIAWGLSLEAMMLLTPYAEVFGYARDSRFMTITLASHACYGIALWLALRTTHVASVRRGRTVATMLAIPFALGAIAADFHRLYAGVLPSSPPPYLGRHLYTTWNTPEPDRIALLWAMKRLVDPSAEFHCIEPFEKARFGVPLDVPEADVRRRAAQSATEVLMGRVPQSRTAKLSLLVRTTHLAEVSRWMLIGDTEATREADFLRHIAVDHCGSKLHRDCLDALFAELDRRYADALR